MIDGSQCEKEASGCRRRYEIVFQRWKLCMYLEDNYQTTRRPVALICKASPPSNPSETCHRSTALPLLGGCASCRTPLSSLVTAMSLDCQSISCPQSLEGLHTRSEAVPGGYRQGIHACALAHTLCHGPARCAPRKSQNATGRFDRALDSPSHSPVRQNGLYPARSKWSSSSITTSIVQDLENEETADPLAQVMT